MKTPTTQLLRYFFLSALCYLPLINYAQTGFCHIQAFVVQVPTSGCQLTEYPIVFKPAQPHTVFTQHLKVRSLSSKHAFEVKRGEPAYTFALKPGSYQFEITDPSTAHCSTIQHLIVRGNDRNPMPTASCDDITISIPKGGQFIDPEKLAGKSYSPCGPLEISLSQYFFSSADIGSNTVEVTVQDPQGRKQKCYSTVEVVPASKQLQTYRETGEPGPGFELCAAVPNPSRAYQQGDGRFRVLAGGSSAEAKQTMLSQARIGNGEIVVKLSAIEGTASQENGRAGLMIRESCAPGAPYLAIMIEANTRTIYKEFRLATDGDIVREWEHRLHAPSWLKLKRKGGQLKAFTSHNGRHWQLAYSISIQMDTVAQWGLTVVHPFPQSRTVATFDDLNIRTEANADYPLLIPSSLDTPGVTPLTGAKNTAPDTYHHPKSKTIMEQEQWSIFPNPAQDYLEVTLPIWKDDHASLHLLNSAGKTILEEQLDVLNGQSHWMNLATVARGIYYLRLQTVEGQHLTKKVIVDK